MEIITVFVSGLFGLVVAITTTILANRTETRSHHRDRKLKRYEALESLYVDAIASLEKSIRRTQQLGDYSELTDEFPRQNARLQLASTKAITEQSKVVSDHLFAWSSEYRQGAPKKIGDTGMAVWGTPDFPHEARAKELFPTLCEEIIKLTTLMKDHLRSIEV